MQVRILINGYFFSMTLHQLFAFSIFLNQIFTPSRNNNAQLAKKAKLNGTSVVNNLFSSYNLKFYNLIKKNLILYKDSHHLLYFVVQPCVK